MAKPINHDTIEIPARFCGPPDSGNGGYVSGRLASFLDEPVEVTLRQPPPLETPLTVERHGSAVKLLHGQTLVAEARTVPFELELPDPPAWEEAQAASRGYRGLVRHDYPSCFVCSPHREASDGLQLFCGPWRNGVVAGTWIPAPDLAGEDGLIRPEFLWCAVDCPGAWSVIEREDDQARLPSPEAPMLLGRLTARVLRPVRPGDECIVMGWPLAHEGRKYHVGAAVVTREGEPVCFGRATWIMVGPRHSGESRNPAPFAAGGR